MLFPKTFKCLFIQKIGQISIKNIPFTFLPEKEVTVRIRYSSINYKDALAITGVKGVIKNAPIIPGIDFSGTVIHSNSPSFKEGDKVLCTGNGLGEQISGGLSQYARVDAQMLQKVPKGLTLFDTMAIGTAGFTAMLSLNAIQNRFSFKENSKKRVLITGASGGVGLYATAFTASQNFKVTASTGRKDSFKRIFEKMGEIEVIGRTVGENTILKPLKKAKWDAVIDCVGGKTLSNALSECNYSAITAICGMAESPDIALSVYPFILRGVSLVGIDSVWYPNDKRQTIWERIVKVYQKDLFNEITAEIEPNGVLEYCEDLLGGRKKYCVRAVVDCDKF